MLRQELASSGAVIAEIVPDLSECLPELAPVAALGDPESARFRLFDALSGFLRAAAESQPLLLVLEDLHWLDNSSLMLLEFMVHEISNARLLMVGTCRDTALDRTHSLSETLAELTRGHQFERLRLQGFTRREVERFIQLTIGHDSPPELAQAVYKHTEGNPLFVSETVRLLVQKGEFTPKEARERRHWHIEVPPGVREVIRRRIDRLSKPCSEALTIGALIGRRFSLQQLESVNESPQEGQDRLLALLEEGLSGKIIQEAADAASCFEFTHALIQETLIEELSAARRIRLHAHIAQELEKLYCDDAEQHAAELVVHFAAAETILGTEKSVHYSLAAGQQALATHAYVEAQEHFERGLSIRRAEPMGEHRRQRLCSDWDVWKASYGGAGEKTIC